MKSVTTCCCLKFSVFHIFFFVILVYKSKFVCQLLFKQYFSLVRNDRFFMVLSVVLKYQLFLFGVLSLCVLISGTFASFQTFISF